MTIFTPRLEVSSVEIFENIIISNQDYPVHQISFLVFYLIPIFFLIFFYTRMINTIRAANTSIRRSIYRGNVPGGASLPDQRRQTIRMLGNNEQSNTRHRQVGWLSWQQVSFFSSSYPGLLSTSRGWAMSTLKLRSSSELSTNISSTSPVTFPPSLGHSLTMKCWCSQESFITCPALSTLSSTPSSASSTGERTILAQNKYFLKQQKIHHSAPLSFTSTLYKSYDNLLFQVGNTSICFFRDSLEIYNIITQL